MPIRVGDKIPEVTLRAMVGGKVEALSTADIFGGKKVVLFAVPGAFTPTCSDAHLPSFQLRADEIKAKGVDTIACVAVNDVFVMDSWGKAREVGDSILLLSDGNGELAKAMDLELDGSGFGLGVRSRRYSALVEDGVVKTFHLEPATGVTVSDADTILGEL